MKKTLTLITAVLLTATVWAQSPEKMSYQAVIRNNSNDLVTKEIVGMKISILQGSAEGTVVYAETQSPETNANGLVSIEIGTGTTSNDFSTIDWTTGPYYIKTETDLNGGANYTIVGTSQLLSVPYALYSKIAGNVFSGNYHDLTNQPVLFDGTWASLLSKPSFATVATSGSYNDLTNQPTQFSGSYNDLTDTPTLFNGTWENITGKPTTLTGYGITDGMNTSHVANGITSGLITNWNTAYSWGNHDGLYRPIGYVPAWNEITGRPTFAAVATSGSYTDLTNTPTITSSQWTTSGSNIYYNSGNVGIGTDNPEFPLTLDNDGGIIAKGVFESGKTLETSGEGSRMIWYPRKAAFRAGYVSSQNNDYWDDTNIGERSVAFGRETRASGDGSTAFGYHAHADGYVSSAIGSGTASGTFSTAMGGGNAYGNVSVAMGKTTAGSYYSCAIGRYNDNTGGNLIDWVPTDPLFIIGNGDASDNRHTAVLVRKDGSVVLPDVYNDPVLSLLPYRDLYISAFGQIGYLASSLRYKKNISSMEDVSWLYQLRPVNFIYNSDNSETKQYGLIAEEVEDVNPLFVSYNDKGEVETVSYSQLVTPMIKALQEQQQLIEELKARIEDLENN